MPSREGHLPTASVRPFAAARWRAEGEGEGVDSGWAHRLGAAIGFGVRVRVRIRVRVKGEGLGFGGLTASVRPLAAAQWSAVLPSKLSAVFSERLESSHACSRSNRSIDATYGAGRAEGEGYR